MFHKIIEEDIQDIILHTSTDLLELEGARILITGGSGMIASYIVYTLLYANEIFFKQPVQIFITIRNKNKKFGRLPNLHYIINDISIKKPSVKNIDYIIHAASKASPKLYGENIIDTLNTNILGLYNLLAICNKNTKSLLYFSSAEIYGSVEKEVSEGYIGTVDHISPRSCYVEAKKVCETICINYFRERNIPVKIARIFHTFGPGINLSDGRVFSDFIKNGLEKKDIEILGNTKLKRSFLYIKDATIMFLKILLSEKNGEIYNVGNDKNTVTVKKFAQIVAECFNKHNKEKIAVIYGKKNNNFYQHAVKSIRPNINKFVKDFGYKPETDVATAVSRTIASFLDN